MKYKYTRKEALKIARDSGYGYNTFEKYLLAKQEDKKEFTHKELSTPYPLDETEDIEEINMATYQGKRDTAIEIMVENKLNELIRNQTKIINYLKSKK